MTEQLVGGVDFSGSKEIPNDTWLAIGRLDGLGLEITGLKKVGSHKLAAEIAALPKLKAVGLDFPFSLPADFVRFCAEKKGAKDFQSWQEVVEFLIFTSFEDFAALIKEFSKDSKRLTDTRYKGLAQSPLHRGNPSMIQMTYQGMRFLASMDPKRFRVLPFHDRTPDSCLLLEVFPRATLWCFGLPDSGYKSKEKKDIEKMQTARRDLLNKLLGLRDRKEEVWRAVPRLSVDKKLQHTAIESDDALDAIIACYATSVWLAAPQLFEDPYDCESEDMLLEGWLYAPVKAIRAAELSAPRAK
jgi:hypothetical protein